jgi:hypothetical protein
VVSDEYTSPIGERPGENTVLQEVMPDLRVNGRERIIEKDDFGVSVSRPSEGDALLLPSTERDAALADFGAAYQHLI